MLEKPEFYEELKGIYCVYCGEQNITQETGEGDFYLGKRCFCLNCGKSFRFE